MAAPELSESEKAFLAALKRRNVRFMVVGLSAAALQGAPVVTQDVDLWFESLSNLDFQAAVRDVGGAYVPPFEMNPPMLAGGGLELFDLVLRMDGLRSFPEEFPDHVLVRIGDVETPALSLARILVSKKAANRQKDRLVIPVLEDAIRANKP